MTRPIALLGFFVLLSGCFNPNEGSCPDGTKDCPCIDLQCEAGLTCQNAVCVDGTPGTGTDTATSMPAETTADPTTATTVTTMPMSSSDSTTVALDEGSTTMSVADTSSDGASSSSTGAPNLCGNATLDSDEECDGTPGCTDCVLDNYDCNPLNNAPCGRGFKCSVYDDEGTAQASCLPFVDPPPGQLYDSNCYLGVPQDNWCDVGLACAVSQAAAACDVNCCVEFCDLTDATFECDFKGATCQPILANGAPEGLHHLGYCIGGM